MPNNFWSNCWNTLSTFGNQCQDKLRNTFASQNFAQEKDEAWMCLKNTNLTYKCEIYKTKKTYYKTEKTCYMIFLFDQTESIKSVEAILFLDAENPEYILYHNRDGITIKYRKFNNTQTINPSNNLDINIGNNPLLKFDAIDEESDRNTTHTTNAKINKSYAEFKKKAPKFSWSNKKIVTPDHLQDMILSKIFPITTDNTLQLIQCSDISTLNNDLATDHDSIIFSDGEKIAEKSIIDSTKCSPTSVNTNDNVNDNASTYNIHSDSERIAEKSIIDSTKCSPTNVNTNDNANDNANTEFYIFTDVLFLNKKFFIFEQYSPEKKDNIKLKLQQRISDISLLNDTITSQNTNIIPMQEIFVSKNLKKKIQSLHDKYHQAVQFQIEKTSSTLYKIFCTDHKEDYLNCKIQYTSNTSLLSKKQIFLLDKKINNQPNHDSALDQESPTNAHYILRPKTENKNILLEMKNFFYDSLQIEKFLSSDQENFNTKLIELNKLDYNIEMPI